MKHPLDVLYGLGDVLDRFFVVLHKIAIKRKANEPFEKEQEDANLIRKYLEEEYSLDLAMHIEALFEANHEIWELESDMRKGKDISDEEAGKRSKQIRLINDKKRIKHRNAINQISGTGITEKKVI